MINLRAPLKQTKKKSLGRLICGLCFPSMGLIDANKSIRIINVKMNAKKKKNGNGSLQTSSQQDENF